MRFVKYLWIVFLIIIVDSCKEKQSHQGYYIISKQDSLLKPPPPPSMEFYTSIVMIFDKADKVYFYQTDCIYNGIIDNLKIGPTPKYPNFIDLKPNHLITIQSEYLINFLKDNDEYFKLDTSYHYSNRLFYIVSDFDTITNSGFYKLKEHIKTTKYTKGRIYYIIRRATEEERNVLSCKRIGKSYNENDFNWSNNFIDGQTNPLSTRYDFLEKHMMYVVKSKETFKPNAINIRPIK